MRRINRLLRETRAALRVLRRPILALIERAGDAWSMVIHLEGAGANEHSEYGTVESAEGYLAKRYPDSDMPVIVDDIPDAGESHAEEAS